MSGQVNISTAFMETMTLEEIEEIEELGGVGFGSFTSGSGVPGKAMRALVYVIRRRTEPALTFDDCRTMTISDFVEVMENLGKPLGKLRKAKHGASA